MEKPLVRQRVRALTTGKVVKLLKNVDCNKHNKSKFFHVHQLTVFEDMSVPGNLLHVLYAYCT
jgi:hypothetical protein